MSAMRSKEVYNVADHFADQRHFYPLVIIFFDTFFMSES